MTQILAAYIILINIVTFWVFGHDKRQARNKGWRVPEKTLFLLAAAGGSIGSVCSGRVPSKTRVISWASIRLAARTGWIIPETAA